MGKGWSQNPELLKYMVQNVQDSMKSIRHEKKKESDLYVGKKEVSRNCLWLPPDVGINRWIFQISYYKYVKIAKGNYV